MLRSNMTGSKKSRLHRTAQRFFPLSRNIIRNRRNASTSTEPVDVSEGDGNVPISVGDEIALMQSVVDDDQMQRNESPSNTINEERRLEEVIPIPINFIEGEFNMLYDSSDVLDGDPFNDKLRQWAVVCNTPRTHLNMLLGLIKPKIPSVPLSYQTLLETPRNLPVCDISSAFC